MATTPKKAINPAPKKVSTSMPLMTISEDAAGIIQTVSNVALIIGSILALLGTIGVFWSQGVLSRYGAERQSQHELKIEEAKGDAAKAQESAANATIESDKLKVVVAEAELKRAQAERELLELKERLAPRAISTEQKQQFSDFVKDAAKGKVRINALVGDNEAVAFAQTLKALLSDNGFTVDEVIGGFMSAGAPVSGIQLRIKSAAAPPAHSGTLQQGLKHIGVTAPAQVEAPELPMEGDTVRVYVYGKN